MFFYDLAESFLKIPEIRELSQLLWSQKNSMLARGKKNRKEETNKQAKKRKAILNCFVYQN